MALVCPNKKSKEWKELVSFYGGNEKKAFAAYVANKQEIPSVESLKEIGVENNEAPRFQRVVENMRRQIGIIEDTKIRIKSKMSDATKKGNTKLVSSLRIELNKANKEIEVLKQKAVDVKKLDGLNSIIPIANEQLELATELLDRETISYENLERVRAISDIWKRAGEIKNGQSIFYTPEELSAIEEGDEVYLEIESKLNGIRSKAERIYDKSMRIGEEILSNLGKQSFDNSTFNIDTTKPVEDVNFWRRMSEPISETDNEIMQLVYKLGSDANKLAMQEVNELVKEIDSIFKKTGITKFDDFAQEFGDGDSRKTGNLVSRFSYKYYDDMSLAKAALERKLDDIAEMNISDDEKIKAKGIAQKNYRKVLKNRQIILDPRLLFPEEEVSKELVDKHISELKSNLGEEGYEYFKNRLEEKVNNYRETKEAYIENLAAQYGKDSTEYFLELQHWEAENSPYLLADRLIDGKGEYKISGQYVSPNYWYVQSVPKKRIDGKDTGYYDTKYAVIESDKNKYELYQYITKLNSTLNKYLGDEISGITPYSIAYIKDKTMSNYLSGGMLKGVSALWEEFRDSYKETNNGEFIPGAKLDSNDAEIVKARAKLITDNRERITDYIKLKQVEYENSNNKKATPEMMSNWKKEILNELAEEKSYDLQNILKMYALSAIQFKYMSRIESPMALANELFRQSFQVQKNSYDSDKVTDFGRKLKEANTSIEMLENTIKNFMGMTTKKKEGVSKEKTYTAKEKRQLEEIDSQISTLQQRYEEKKITKEKFDKDIQTLLKAKDNIGGYFNKGEVASSFLKYYQLLGMGWNGFAGIINVGVGQINNYIEAAGGERFTTEDLNKGNLLVTNSILKGSTMEIINTPTARKIRALMERYQVLKEAQYEIRENINPMSKFLNTGKTKYLNPYTASSMTEYINQAPIMIAILNKTKVKDSNGNEINLWDAYDEEGKLKEGIEFNESDFTKTATKIDEAIDWVHGNYNPNKPVMYKNRLIGKALFMFRGWLPMSIRNRWGGERYDYAIGAIKKGRYLSYGTLFKEYGAMNATTEIIKALLKKLGGLPIVNKVTGINSNELFESLVNDTFTEHDAANLRRNMQELLAYAGLIALTLLLKAGIDDEDEESKATYYFWINQINRAQSDLAFYINPAEFVKLNSSVIPAINAVNNLSKATNYSVNYLFGGEDIYQAGPHKGESKSIIAWSKAIPGATQLPRLSSARDRVFEQNTLTDAIMNDEN